MIPSISIHDVQRFARGDCLTITAHVSQSKHTVYPISLPFATIRIQDLNGIPSKRKHEKALYTKYLDVQFSRFVRHLRISQLQLCCVFHPIAMCGCDLAGCNLSNFPSCQASNGRPRALRLWMFWVVVCPTK